MAAAIHQSIIKVTVNLHVSPKGEKPPKAAAYAFTSNGRYLTSAELDGKGSATLQVPLGQTAQDIRVVVGPKLQKEINTTE
jgi:hypothetical protein